MHRSHTLQKNLGRAIGLIFLALVYLYLLGPMFVVIIASFNSAIAFPSPFESFSFQWYEALFRHDEFIKSMWVSVRVGAAAAAIATVLGIPLSIWLVRTDYRGKEAVNAFFLTPLIIPQVALSIALLQMFSLLKIRLSDLTLILAHTVFVMPYVIRSGIASLHFVDISVEEASMNLGANRLQTFWHVTFPLIRAGITAGFVLAFIMSFINVPLSLFLSTPARVTFPIRVFAHMESRLDPIIAAVGAVTVFGVTIVTLFLEKVLKVRLVL